MKTSKEKRKAGERNHRKEFNGKKKKMKKIDKNGRKGKRAR